jgi:hypothetical protein
VKSCSTQTFQGKSWWISTIHDEEGEDRDCNCKPGSKCENSECYTEATAARSMLIYEEIKDSITGKSYICKTQQFLKKRTSDHMQTSGNAKKNNKTYKKDDSFLRHFSTYCFDCTNSNQVREPNWKGSWMSIFIGKGRGSNVWKQHVDCRICMKERITIMQTLRDDKYKVIKWQLRHLQLL